MKNVASVLKDLVTATTAQFLTLPESEWAAKPLPSRWSKKEILGHLIDSALNNHRRFLVTQYVQNQHIVYNQDYWVAMQDYQHSDTQELIQLWRLLNLQIVRVLENMPAAAWSAQVDMGKGSADLRTLEWLAGDYVGHLRHHLEKL